MPNHAPCPCRTSCSKQSAALEQQVVEVVDDFFSPSKRPEARYLWKTQRERTAWLVSTVFSATFTLLVVQVSQGCAGCWDGDRACLPGQMPGRG